MYSTAFPARSRLPRTTRHLWWSASHSKEAPAAQAARSCVTGTRRALKTSVPRPSGFKTEKSWLSSHPRRGRSLSLSVFTNAMHSSARRSRWISNTTVPTDPCLLVIRSDRSGERDGISQIWISKCISCPSAGPVSSRNTSRKSSATATGGEGAALRPLRSGVRGEDPGRGGVALPVTTLGGGLLLVALRLFGREAVAGVAFGACGPLQSSCTVISGTLRTRSNKGGGEDGAAASKAASGTEEATAPAPASSAVAFCSRPSLLRISSSASFWVGSAVGLSLGPMAGPFTALR
mmetsp:Transcript_39241/g.61756  ORF Transcript_39241/g.61756 Transcript_39241/m.61756 type:complete len:292 (+) Transcript_39241:227-1102(+)